MIVSWNRWKKHPLQFYYWKPLIKAFKTFKALSKIQEL